MKEEIMQRFISAAEQFIVLSEADILDEPMQEYLVDVFKNIIDDHQRYLGTERR